MLTKPQGDKFKLVHNFSLHNATMDACAGGIYELKVDNEKLQFKADEKYLESLEVRINNITI